MEEADEPAMPTVHSSISGCSRLVEWAAVYTRQLFGYKWTRRREDSMLGSFQRAASSAPRPKAQQKVIMAQAIMDPEKVRRFADELNRFNTDLENRLVLLQARFTSLGDTWQDQEHEKFAEEFRTAMKALKKFVELSKAHTPYLLRKAQRIEEYLHQR
jgi:uncharacterized protein YukE